MTDVVELERDATADINLPAFADPKLGTEQGLVLSDRADAFLPVKLEDVRAIASMLEALPGRKEFQRPGACEGIVLQAALWRVSPLFVLQCAYQASDKTPIAYESKLINAVILANGPLARRPRLKYGYGGDGKHTAANRFVEATFWLIGEDEPFKITSPTVSQITPKNSPLWFSDPDQQLSYYVIRAGARRYFPDVLGGAYTREEAIQMRNVTPDRARITSLLDDDAVDAEFGEAVPPTDANRAGFTAWEKKAKAKAEGVQDSRDPRDAPSNASPEPPPSDRGEPEDMASIREWAAGEQTRILEMTKRTEAASAWNDAIKDKRWGRLKAYDQGVANAIKTSVTAHVQGLA